MQQSVQLTDSKHASGAHEKPCAAPVKDASAVAVEVWHGDTPGLLVPFHLLAAPLLVFMAAHFACSIRSGVYVFWRTAPHKLLLPLARVWT